MSDLESVLAYCETQIPWWQPQVGREERTLIGQVLDSQFLNDGAVTREFEQVLAERLGCRHVVTVTSGTAALFAALYGLGIGPGDEVIVPDVTFVATANAVTLTGATPILVDVEPQRLTLDPRAVRQALTPKTKALVPVHLSGRAADMETLLTIADEHNLVVVEDAAEALFSSRQGRCLGTFGQAGCFSFSPMKMIQTGQGGAIATNDDTLFVRLKEIKDQGRRETGTGGGDDVHHAVGFNFKLTNLHAAVGLVQLNRAQDRRERVIRHYRLYQKHLAGLEQVQVLPFAINEGETPLWVDALVQRRDDLIAFLKEQSIDCRSYWQPLHCQPPYRESDDRFPCSTELAGRASWLPSAFTLLDDDIIRVCEEIRRFYRL